MTAALVVLVGWAGACGGSPSDDPDGGSSPFVEIRNELSSFSFQVIAAAGDCDGDGAGDAVLTGSVADVPRLAVHSGTDGRLIVDTREAASGFTSLSSASGGPDVDGDGRPEIAAKASAEDGDAIVLYSCGAATFETIAVAGFDWLNPVRRVRWVPDVDGDGLEDLYVEGTHHPGGPLLETFAILSAVDGQPIYFPLPDASNLTLTAKPVGDFDGDGRDDWLIITTEEISPVARAVTLEIVDGATFPTTETVLWSLEGDGDSSVYDLGDVDGDGADDVAVRSIVTRDGIHGDRVAIHSIQSADPILVKEVLRTNPGEAPYGWGTTFVRVDLDADGTDELLTTTREGGGQLLVHDFALTTIEAYAFPISTYEPRGLELLSHDTAVAVEANATAVRYLLPL